MDSADIKRRLLLNAQEIAALQTRIHDTVRFRGDGPKQRSDWERACEEFHARYDELAFPGGYSSAFDRILAGDQDAIEVALCFLECRPYFFRSGYMWKEILRKMKRAALSQHQLERLVVVRERYAEWRSSKHVV